MVFEKKRHQPLKLRHFPLIQYLLYQLVLAGAVLGGDAPLGTSSGPVILRGQLSPIVINEVMALNTRTAQDPQEQYNDWIELHNVTDTAVDMAGRYLTDDLTQSTKWRFPETNPLATVVPAHGYLLIWADSDTQDAGLHANFKLASAGEEIGLFEADGSTLMDSIAFDEQHADISYGRFPDGSDDMRYMVQSSPGQPNVGHYEGLVADVRFSRTSDFFVSPFELTLYCDTDQAIIYYTLDGSDPFSSARGRITGRRYTGPITISSTAIVRAVGFRPDYKQSQESEHSFVRLSDNVLDFSSNLPIIVIDTAGKSINEGQQTPALVSIISPSEQSRARVEEEPDFLGRAGINVRGKSSAGFAKKQYHLETWDELNQDLDESLLGLPAESDWVLQGPYSDKSLMRNALVYQWSNEIGRYAPKTRFVEVFLNIMQDNLSLSDYVGVYVFMEKIKIGPDRVDITRLNAGDVNEPEITGGYIVKKDKADGTDQTIRTSRGHTLACQSGGKDLTTAQKAWIQAYINEFESALYGRNFTDTTRGYAQYIDTDSFIDHHILVELAKNIDGFRISTYMFKERAGKLKMGPVWDYNLSLGNANYLEGWQAMGWYNRLLSAGDYPWWRRLFEDPAFRRRYADRWFTLRQGQFTRERLLGRIDEYTLLLDEAQARNFERWRILGSYVWPNWFIADSFDQEILWMKGWLSERLTWMDAQIGREYAAPGPTLSPAGGAVEPGTLLSLHADAGTIYYSLDGTDPIEGQGGRSRSVSVYTDPLALNQSTIIKSRTLTDQQWSALSTAAFSVGPVAESLRITEIMYHPHDPNTEFIELTNIGEIPINLKWIQFTKGIKYSFPDLELQPHDFLLVVRDTSAFMALYGPDLPVVGQYVGSLKNQGEILEMRDATGALVSAIHFQNQWYEITDGRGFSLTLRDPYTTDPNALSAKGLWQASAYVGGSPGFDDIGSVPEPGVVVISEVLANPGPGLSDWIELHNTTDQALDLGGWFLSDDIDNLAKYEIAPGVRIEPSAYLVFARDTHFGNAHDTGMHESFALSANGETLYLHSGQQGAITGYSEAAGFGPSLVGESYGRQQTDFDSADLAILVEPSPGSANRPPKSASMPLN
jgi:hypothetical protein